MKGKLLAVQPRLDQQTGMQRSYNTQNGPMYVFDATVANEQGQQFTGEVSGKTAGTYRFQPGADIEFTAEQGQYGVKLKISSPDGDQRGGKSSGGWSPQKEASVMVQGLLKSVIEAGIPGEKWEAAVRQAVSVHDKITAEIGAAKAAQAPQAPLVAPAMPMSQSGGMGMPPQPVYPAQPSPVNLQAMAAQRAGMPVMQPITAGRDESDLGF